MVIKKLKDGVRRALEIQKPRELPAAGPIPRVGAYIAKDDVRIWVNEEITWSLWNWLTARDWREVDLGTDRRRYRAAKPSAIDELAFADDMHRDAIETRLMFEAEMTDFERNRKVQAPRKR